MPPLPSRRFPRSRSARRAKRSPIPKAHARRVPCRRRQRPPRPARRTLPSPRPSCLPNRCSATARAEWWAMSHAAPRRRPRRTRRSSTFPSRSRFLLSSSFRIA
ncbi:MAG: hypothetical protein EKK29_21295, partial [Hyphomicrobiales bacterium]